MLTRLHGILLVHVKGAVQAVQGCLGCSTGFLLVTWCGLVNDRDPCARQATGWDETCSRWVPPAVNSCVTVAVEGKSLIACVCAVQGSWEPPECAYV